MLTHSTSGMLSDRTRQRMAHRLAELGIHNQRVLKAIEKVPRHFFVDEALATRAYDDISLPIGQGQTISQPYIVARMTELLCQNKIPHKVLEIGTGCGYQSAILLASGVPEVYSIERLAVLLDLARRNLRRAGLTRIRLVHHDGQLGLPEVAPFDGIIITAAAKTIPDALFDQLAIGGRLIVPVGDSKKQHLWSFEKLATGLQKTRLEAVNFVPLLTGKA